jgi:hypothetical protein
MTKIISSSRVFAESKKEINLGINFNYYNIRKVKYIQRESSKLEVMNMNFNFFIAEFLSLKAQISFSFFAVGISWIYLFIYVIT